MADRSPTAPSTTGGNAKRLSERFSSVGSERTELLSACQVTHAAGSCLPPRPPNLFACSRSHNISTPRGRPCRCWRCSRGAHACWLPNGKVRGGRRRK